MANRRTYECFACKRQGFDNVQVYLDGKDDQGHTKYLNEDMTVHTHQGSSSSSNGSGTTVTQSQTQPQPQQQPLQQQEQTIPLLKVINAKLDRLVTLLVEDKETEKEKEQK